MYSPLTPGFSFDGETCRSLRHRQRGRRGRETPRGLGDPLVCRGVGEYRCGVDQKQTRH